MALLKDHTNNGKYGIGGHVMSLKQDVRQFTDVGHSATFFTSLVNPKEVSCATFWYKINVDSTDGAYPYITVRLMKGFDREDDVAVSPLVFEDDFGNGVGNVWKLGFFEVDYFGSWKLAFVGTAAGKLEVHDLVLIDDIDITRGRCPSPSYCSFDDDDRCLWTNVDSLEVNLSGKNTLIYSSTSWSRHPATIEVAVNETILDATGKHGGFLLTEGQPIHSLFMSPRLKGKFNDTGCLSFAIYDSEKDIPSVSVYTLADSDTEAILLYKYDARKRTPNAWTAINVDMLQAKSQRFFMVAEKKDAFGWTAIDDISVDFGGRCPPEGEGNYTCQWGDEIPMSKVCDNQFDCPMGDDEEGMWL
ncbi:hypothetical protein HDE_14307 [Halotydeus destructor]|nr:hypothetical protein HDE_14307 [Halotydeus destructor]